MFDRTQHMKQEHAEILDGYVMKEILQDAEFYDNASHDFHVAYYPLFGKAFVCHYSKCEWIDAVSLDEAMNIFFSNDKQQMIA